jgi:hypothetical protein
VIAPRSFIKKRESEYFRKSLFFKIIVKNRNNESSHLLLLCSLFLKKTKKLGVHAGDQRKESSGRCCAALYNRNKSNSIVVCGVRFILVKKTKIFPLFFFLFLFFYFISVLEFQSASVIKKWKGKVIFGTTPRHYLLSIKTRCFCYIVFHDYRVVICIDIENSSPFSFYSYRIKKKRRRTWLLWVRSVITVLGKRMYSYGCGSLLALYRKKRWGLCAPMICVSISFFSLSLSLSCCDHLERK